MAVDMFLKIEGVEGEEEDAKHKGEIRLESKDISAVQEGSANLGKGMGAGKVAFHDVNCTARTSKASPTLMMACASGEHFKKATITARKAGKDQQDYLIITLSDVLVSSFHIGASATGSDIPLDTFALNFSKIEFEYKEQKADGTLGGKVKKGWDVKTNKAS